LSFARQGEIDLTIFERWPRSACPNELLRLEEEGVLRYLTWEDCFQSAALWQVAYLVTGASSHHQIIHRLLEGASGLKVIVCEKPCGENLNQALEIFYACQQRRIALLVADHYLLRPGIQYLLSHPEMMRSIGKPVRIVAAINESKSTGPPQQSVLTDLLIHPLNLLLILFPGAIITPHVAYTAQVLNTDNGHETYTLAVGKFTLPDGTAVSCEIEGGKQLPTDDKSIIVIGTRGKLFLDLLNNTLTLTTLQEGRKEFQKKWEPNWSYAQLISKSLSLSSQNPVPSCPK